MFWNSCFLQILSTITFHLLTYLSFISCSVAKLCPILGDPMDCSTPASILLHYLWSLLKFMSIESVMLSKDLILCCPFLLLPSVFPSIRVFFNESVLCKSCPQCLNFNFSNRMNILDWYEYSGLISFRIDKFDLHAVQGTLKSLLQYHYSKASVLLHSAFFVIQLSHLYITTGKTILLTIQTWMLCQR